MLRTNKDLAANCVKALSHVGGKICITNRIPQAGQIRFLASSKGCLFMAEVNSWGGAMDSVEAFVDPKTLAKVFSSKTSETVSFYMEEEFLRLELGGGSYKIPSDSSQYYSRMPEVPGSYATIFCEVSQVLLHDMIDSVLFNAADKNQCMEILHGGELTFSHETQNVSLICTDGHRAGVSQAYRNVGVAVTESKTHSAHFEVLSFLVKNLEHKDLTVSRVQIHQTLEGIWFRWTTRGINFSVLSQSIEGKLPNIPIPQEFKHTSVFERESVEALKQALMFAYSKENYRTKVSLGKVNDGTFTCASPEGEATEVLTSRNYLEEIEEYEILCNGKSLLEALRKIDGPAVELRFNDPLSMFQVKPIAGFEGLARTFYLVMPMLNVLR